MIESYKTVLKALGSVELKEKGSRFISCCFHVNSKDDIDNILKSLKKEYYNSTHICYAFVLGNGTIQNFRYCDDGEPAGTAGLPIYNEILRKEIFNVLVTVIRYYGGVKLGTGGLARAYGGSARLALEKTVIEVVTIKECVTLNVPFEMTGIAMNHLNQFDELEICENIYNESGIILTVNVPVKNVQNFKDIIIEKSSGKIKII